MKKYIWLWIICGAVGVALVALGFVGLLVLAWPEWLCAAIATGAGTILGKTIGDILTEYNSSKKLKIKNNP